MPAMARRNAHEERWARYVIEAAKSWGHTGQVIYDRRRRAVAFGALGEVPLDDPTGRIANYVEEEQRNEMAARCHRLLEQHFVTPPEWVTGDDELDRAIRRELVSVRKYPNSPRPQAGVARIGRQLGIDGWEERWRWAAERHVADGVEKRLRSSVRAGILMWLELGETERAAAAADHIVRRFAADGGDVDVAEVHETRLTDHVLAVWWRDGRAALAATVERRPSFGGNTMVEAFALAAVAAETGLVDELREQVERLEQMERQSHREAGPHAFHDGHEIRHIVEVVRSWLNELDPTSVGAAVEEPVRPPSVRVSPSTPAAGVTSLEWRGDVLVAEATSGAVAIDLDGRPALAPPPPAGDDTVARLRRVDDSIVLDRADGTSVTLPADWDEDALESVDELEVVWSPSGDRLAAWGESGPICVFAADGSPAGRFLDHWKSPTYGVTLGHDRMMSWARDGRAVVYDLERRVVAGAIQMNGWPEDAAMDASGRVVLTFDNVDGSLARDVDSGERLGPTRPATRAVVHPIQPVVGFSDGDQIWIESYRT